MSDNRERIAELLEDETRSFRSISRELGVSDWLVRKTARDLYNDPRPMKQHRAQSGQPPAQDVSALIGWLIFGGFVAVIAFAIWATARWAPPPDSADFSRGFYPNPPPERKDE